MIRGTTGKGVLFCFPVFFSTENLIATMLSPERVAAWGGGQDRPLNRESLSSAAA